MRGRLVLVVAWLLVSLALGVGGRLLSLARGATGSNELLEWGGVAVVVVLSGLGGVLVVRRPRNAVGWLFSLLAMTFAAGSFLNVVARPGVDGARWVPGAPAAAWLLGAVVSPATWVAMLLTVLVLPEGRLPSPRWRWLAWAVAANFAVLGLITAITPGPMNDVGPPNPLGIHAAQPTLDAVGAVVWVAAGLLAIGVASSLVVRYRRARGVERQQLRLLAACGSLVALGGFGSLLVQPLQHQGGLAIGWVFSILMVAGLVGVPVAVALAVLRHGLYDIDHILSRTVSYALLTGLLAALYLVGVVVLQVLLRPLTGESQVAVAGATLGVAAVFGPARRRVQREVDRRFNRARYDARVAVERYATRLREAVDLDQVSHDLTAVVRTTVQPTAVAVWMKRQPAPDRPAARIRTR